MRVKTDRFDPSPLTEGRGLKRLAVEESMFNPMVAPHGGAWIETEDVAKECEERLVAPHGGAWIETYITKRKGKKRRVAPHGGAWIET